MDAKGAIASASPPAWGAAWSDPVAMDQLLVHRLVRPRNLPFRTRLVDLAVDRPGAPLTMAVHKYGARLLDAGRGGPLRLPSATEVPLGEETATSLRLPLRNLVPPPRLRRDERLARRGRRPGGREDTPGGLEGVWLRGECLPNGRTRALLIRGAAASGGAAGAFGGRGRKHRTAASVPPAIADGLC